ncbi:MAG: trypsin-like serine protease [Anaerolineales bacterium]
MEMNASAIALAQQAKRQNESRLMRMNNVVAVGIGFKTVGGVPTSEISIIVSVIKKLPGIQVPESARVPRALGGVQTDVVETGKIFALQDPKQKMRPARPGVSIGHYQITAGTLGCLVHRNGQVYILSNNHVLANSNDGQLGDAILQPGPHDGGTSADQIGTLEQFVPVGFGISTGCGCSPFAFLLRLLGAAKPMVNEPGNNTVDCAIAKPLSADLVNPDILNIGIPSGVGTATLGTAVQKSGRTTGHTTDQITQLDVTVSVAYGSKIAVFKNQLMAGAMSQGGDSGSAVLDMDKQVVGLLFAGSNTTTIMNPIQFVLDALQVQLVTG